MNQAIASVSLSQTGRRATPTGGKDGPTSWLVCRAGVHLFALPLECVIECMRVLPIEAVAGAPRYVRGLCMIRGAPLPVVDPGLILGDRPSNPGRLATMRVGGRAVVVAAEEVLGIRTIAAGTLSELPPLLQDAFGDAVAAIGALDAELLFVLRAARIVPESVLDQLARDGESP